MQSENDRKQHLRQMQVSEVQSHTPAPQSEEAVHDVPTTVAAEVVTASLLSPSKPKQLDAFTWTEYCTVAVTP
jgi:hypothetical protein